MAVYAVIARADKNLGGGLPELRQVLGDAGVSELIWREVPAGSDVAASVREVVDAGAELLFVWGGDGTVQRCIDCVAGSDVAIAILPAGGGNLLARDMEVPLDVQGAVEVALYGDRRRIDTVVTDGEHFAIVAGAGLSSMMMRDHHKKGIVRRVERASRLLIGAIKLRVKPVHCRIDVDGQSVYDGDMTCVLVSNVRRAVDGISEFENARDDDGIVEVGVVGRRQIGEWLSSCRRVLWGRAEPDPFLVTTAGSQIQLRFDRAVAFELDGSPKGLVTHAELEVRPRSVSVCVPARSQPSTRAMQIRQIAPDAASSSSPRG